MFYYYLAYSHNGQTHGIVGKGGNRQSAKNDAQRVITERFGTFQFGNVIDFPDKCQNAMMEWSYASN